jgi:hypothetical protein
MKFGQFTVKGLILSKISREFERYKGIRGRGPKENADSCGELEILRAREVSLDESKGRERKDIGNGKIARL